MTAAINIITITIIFIVIPSTTINAINTTEYWNQRSNFIQIERDMFFGSNITLTNNEIRVNNILMAAKYSEFDNCFDPLCFPPARHFFQAKQDIENSQVFNIIKIMPKGAALHGHDTGMVTTEWLVSNATYRSNLYACVRNSQLNPPPAMGLDLIRLIFDTQLPNASNCQEGVWILVSNLRDTNGAQVVDPWFAQHFTLITDNPYETYPDINVAWVKFMGLFDIIGGMVSYGPVFHDYYVQTLQELYDDNIQYLELRGLLLPTYELNGTTSDMFEVATMYELASTNFMAAQPVGSWLGARFIFAPTRLSDNNTVSLYINQTQQLLTMFPDYIAGFDLVGQEDKGGPYTDFINQLLELRENVPDIKYFFHAGETNWQGLTDMNLIDVILLNASRIGHGYAINKHPHVLQKVKENGIALEVNPISNQVLKLVDDLRNHPIAGLLAQDYPIVVSCDDPSFWGAKGLSYDYYQMFMGLGGRDADLRFLKQLAINSINYSAMDAFEKNCAFEAWNIKWEVFLANVLSETPPNTQPSPECITYWNSRIQISSNKVHI